MFVSPVLASAPGQPMGCDDATLLIPGLSAEPFLPPLDTAACRDESNRDFLRCGLSVPSSRQDAESSAYALFQTVERRELWRTRANGASQLVATIPTNRLAPN